MKITYWKVSSFLQLLMLMLCFLQSGQAIDRKAARFSDLLKNITKNGYDKRIRPSAEATNVTTQIYLVDLGPVDQKAMSLRSEIILCQWWNDPRLAFDNTSVLNYNGDPSQDIWIPDLYVTNARESKSHYGLMQNVRTKIGPNGNAYTSFRLTIEFKCLMDFKLYPFDTQKCSMVLESYAYSAKEMNLTWKPRAPAIEFVMDDLHPTGYRLTKIEGTSTNLIYVEEAFTSLEATFYMERLFSYYLYHVYMPGASLVALSWCTFWMPVSAVPARVTLIVTNFLSSVFVLNSAGSAIPKVWYHTPLELYVLTNICFISLAMVEYIIVLNTPKLMKKEKSKYFFATPLKRRNSKVEIEKSRQNDQRDMNKSGKRMQKDEDTSDISSFGNASKSVHGLDLISRVLIPVVYAIFLIAYFVYYTSKT